MLREAGASVDEVVAYQNKDVEALPEPAASLLESGSLDWIALSSPSIARRLAAILTPTARAHMGRSMRLAAISPVTEAAAVEAGLPVSAVASVYTWDGLLDAIVALDRGG
jgi:uroporphyrinogen III methyltransferase/synthase